MCFSKYVENELIRMAGANGKIMVVAGMEPETSSGGNLLQTARRPLGRVSSPGGKTPVLLENGRQRLRSPCLIWKLKMSSKQFQRNRGESATLEQTHRRCLINFSRTFWATFLWLVSFSEKIKSFYLAPWSQHFRRLDVSRSHEVLWPWFESRPSNMTVGIPCWRQIAIGRR